MPVPNAGAEEPKVGYGAGTVENGAAPEGAGTGTTTGCTLDPPAAGADEATGTKGVRA